MRQVVALADRDLCFAMQQGPISLAEAAHQLMGDVPDAKRAQTQVTAHFSTGLRAQPLLTWIYMRGFALGAPTLLISLHDCCSSYASILCR